MKQIVKRSIAYLLSMALALGLLVSPVALPTTSAAGADYLIQPLALGPQGSTADGLAFGGKATGITVDGNLDEDAWSQMDSYRVAKIKEDTVVGNTTDFATAWDSTNLYIGVNVKDSVITTANTTSAQYYVNDGVEIFIDANNNKTDYKDGHVYHIYIVADGERVLVQGGSAKDAWTATDDLDEMMEYKIATTDDGYSVEVSIPWEVLEVTPGDGTVLGFAVANNDAENNTADSNDRMEINWLEGHNSGQPATWGTLCLYETKKPLVSTEGTPSLSSGEQNWDESIWNFSDYYSLDFAQIPDAKLKFASLSDFDGLYLAYLVEGAGDDSLPYVSAALSGTNRRAEGLENFDHRFQSLLLTTNDTSWKRFNNNPKLPDGVTSITSVKYELGDGSYAVVIRFPWDNLGIIDDPDHPRANYSVMSFGLATGYDWGAVKGTNTEWIDGFNYWTNPFTHVASLLIYNPNIVKKDDSVNTPPTGTPYYAVSVEQGKSVSGTVKVTDADGDTLTYTVEQPAEGKGTVTLDETTPGKWTYTAPADLLTGTGPGVSFYVVADDGKEGTFRTRVEVKVEHTPTNLTYYVNGDTGSDDNDGLTEDTALKTIMAAHNKTNPGDTVIIHESTIPYGWHSTAEYEATPGLYDSIRDGMISITRSGLPEAHITYKAATGETPVIMGNGVWDTFLVSANYIDIEGLTFRGEADKLTYDDAWRQFWGRIAPTDDEGFLPWADVKGEPASEVNSNGFDVRPASGQKFSDGGEDGLLSDKVSIPHHITVKNCVSMYFGGTGFGGTECDWVTYDNCTSLNNCWWGQYGNSGIGFITIVDVDDNTTDYKIVIRDCVSAGNRHFIPWRANTVRFSDGNGIIMDTITAGGGNHGYRGKTLIANNLVYENGGSGIHLFRCDNVDVINNTIVNNVATPNLASDGNWSELDAQVSKNVHMYNNLVYSRTGVAEKPGSGAPSAGNTVTYDYNLFYNYGAGSTVGAAAPGVTVGEHNITEQDPNFISFTARDNKGTFDPKHGYDETWYVEKDASDATTPKAGWSKAGNAALAGWYPEADYDVTGYGYDFTLAAGSPAKGTASAEWQAKAGGADYDNVIGIFSEVGANVEAALGGETPEPNHPALTITYHGVTATADGYETDEYDTDIVYAVYRMTLPNDSVKPDTNEIKGIIQAAAEAVTGYTDFMWYGSFAGDAANIVVYSFEVTCDDETTYSYYLYVTLAGEPEPEQHDYHVTIKYAYDIEDPDDPDNSTGVSIDAVDNGDGTYTLYIGKDGKVPTAEEITATLYDGSKYVEAGTVTAGANGTFTITFTKAYGAIPASITLNVVSDDAPEEPAPSYTLTISYGGKTATQVGTTNAYTLELPYGSTYPDANAITVTWTPVDALDRVDVTDGLEDGEYNLTAVYADFSGADRYTLKVTIASAPVTPPPTTVAVTGVTLNKTALSLTVGGSETLTATVAPSNATNKTVTWTSSDPAVATVSNGTVTAVAAGTATITATAGGKSATCTVTVTAAEDPGTDDPGAEEPKVETTPVAKVETGDNGTTVSAAVTEEQAEDMVKQAEDKEADVVVIKPSIPEDVDSEEITSAEVTIPAKSLTELSEKTEASVTVETPVGSVTIPNDALDELGSAGSSVSVKVEREDDGATKVEVKVDDKNIDKVEDGLKVSLPLQEGQVVVLVAEDGTETVIAKSVVEDGTAYVLLDGSATIKVIDNDRDFEDVKDDQWFASAVDFASSHELFVGTSDTEFSPNGNMTRSMLVMVLWRLESEAKAGEGAIVFDDAESGADYAAAMAWASAAKIVSGTGDNKFSPDREITRQELVTILYRYAKHIGLDTSSHTDVSNSGVADWAEDAMSWAVATRLIVGGDNGIDPTGTASRAQVAIILQRLVSLIVK